MRKRLRLKGKKRIGKFNKKEILVIIFIFLIVAIYFSFKFINLKVNPILLDYAELESRKLASIVINNAVSKNVAENIDVEELFLITKDNNGEWVAGAEEVGSAKSAWYEESRSNSWKNF